MWRLSAWLRRGCLPTAADIGGDVIYGDKFVFGLRFTPKVRPAQLPSDDPAFTGREGQLAHLDWLLQTARQASCGLIVALHGMPGVGKTALAVHWACRLRTIFPDGQLFLDLRGYCSGSAMTSAEALGQLLRSLGVDADTIPTEEAEQQALFRSLTAGKNMLVLFDNAASTEQVRPLLPGHSCLTIVTSRRMLTGLVAHEGARSISVGLLTLRESMALMRTMLGDRRVDDEPVASADLGERCAYLPLALRIAVAGLELRPHKPIASTLQELSTQHRLSRLELDDDPQNAVRAAFARSYRDLTPALRCAFRYLSLIDGPDFTPEHVATLLDIDEPEARRQLCALEREHLVEVTTTGRYRLHDLINDFGRECLAAEDPIARRRALRRYLEYCLTHVEKRDIVWCEAERCTLVAAVRQAAADYDPIACHLAAALHDFLQTRRYARDDVDIHEVALDVAAHLQEENLQLRMALNLGQAYWQAGDYDAALDAAVRSLELCRGRPERSGEGEALLCMARTYLRLADPDKARRYADAAWRIYRDLRDLRGQANALDVTVQVCRSLGRCGESLGWASRALKIRREIGDRPGEAAILDNVARSLRRLRRQSGALDHAYQALKIRAELADEVGEGQSHETLARIHRGRGDFELAMRHAESALRLRRTVGDRWGEAETLEGIARILRSDDRPEEALGFAHQALLLVDELGDLQAKASTLDCLARIHGDLGRLERALEYAKEAVLIGDRVRDWFGQGRRLHNRGVILLRLGRPTFALVDLRAALRVQRDSDDRLGELLTLESLAEACAAIGDESGRRDAMAKAGDLRCRYTYLRDEVFGGSARMAGQGT